MKMRFRREAVTQPGDLWLLGNHRLLCGDSTSGAHVATLINRRTISLTAF
jgi:hypothetical protein